MGPFQRVAKVVGLRRALLRLAWFYPPFLGAGIRVRAVNDDLTRVEVVLCLRAWTRNYVGTQFGGSLYAMTDPFFMIMLMHHLGPDYVVWDKSSTIDFIKPGRADVVAVFEMPLRRVAEIRAAADSGEKVLPRFQAEIRQADGTLVARVDKQLYVRKRR